MRSIKTQLKINNKERTLLMKHAGTARHAYNWGLDYCIKKLNAGEPIPSAIDLHKILNAEVKTANIWYYEVSKCAPQQALRDLQKAFKKFWETHHKNKTQPFNKRYHKKFLKQKEEGKINFLSFEHEKGFPKFKKKGERDGFYLDGSIKPDVENRKIKLPRIGWIKTYERIFKADGIKINSVSITRKADDWFIAFRIGDKLPIANGDPASKTGVDLGIKKHATLSNGKTFDSPKAYQKYKKKLKRLQKKLSHQYGIWKKKEEEKALELKKAGKEPEKPKETHIHVSNNYQKLKKQIAKLHQKIANIRLDFTHKLTAYLVKNQDRISIEDLNVAGMVKNHNLASAILDGGFYEFKRQLIYKCKWNNVELVIADRWFASSQICSCCGHRQKMPLKKRIFDCEKCHLKIDRDINAAINLSKYNTYYGILPPQGKADLKTIRLRIIHKSNTLRATEGESVRVNGAKFHDENQVGICETETRQQSA